MDVWVRRGPVGVRDSEGARWAIHGSGREVGRGSSEGWQGRGCGEGAEMSNRKERGGKEL